jgi:hypothetical protein
MTTVQSQPSSISYERVLQQTTTNTQLVAVNPQGTTNTTTTQMQHTFYSIKETHF